MISRKLKFKNQTCSETEQRVFHILNTLQPNDTLSTLQLTEALGYTRKLTHATLLRMHRNKQLSLYKSQRRECFWSINQAVVYQALPIVTIKTKVIKAPDAPYKTHWQGDSLKAYHSYAQGV